MKIELELSKDVISEILNSINRDENITLVINKGSASPIKNKLKSESYSNLVQNGISKPSSNFKKVILPIEKMFDNSLDDIPF